jgi:hypothetical protein
MVSLLALEKTEHCCSKGKNCLEDRNGLGQAAALYGCRVTSE